MSVRHILGAGYRSHTDPLFASNKILKIKDLVKYMLLTIAHKAFYASCPLPPLTVMNLFCISEPPNTNYAGDAGSIPVGAHTLFAIEVLWLQPVTLHC